MKLSEKRIELRKANGWSQEDLAEKVDVSRQAQGEGIFAVGEIPGTWSNSIAIRSKMCYNKIRKAVER